MIKARIYKPSKSAMQSVGGNTKQWILEYQSAGSKNPDPLMGWTQSTDTLAQVRVKFATLEDAEKYAEEKELYYKVEPERKRKVKPRNYGDNFLYIPAEESKK